jgi:MHS family proline/betaine transporter-like MFS transporter
VSADVDVDVISIPRSKPRSVSRVIVAATIGNMFEWYDFVIYAAFAIPISRAFFPNDSETVSLLLSLITFGLGFIARPFGAILLGGYADRRGRSKALSLTILLMAFGTTIIAVCPGYDRIGLAAPIIIIAARLIQGFSAGGEIGGAISMLVEHAPDDRRGFYSSFQQLAQGAQIMLAGLVPLVLALLLPPDAIDAWGWRLAFCLGLLIVPVGLYIRRKLDEAPIFKATVDSHPARLPITVVLQNHWREVLTGIFIVLMWTVSQYIVNSFPVFAQKQLHVSLSASYVAPVVVGLVLMLCPLVGALADRFQRKRVMLVGSLGLFCVAYPAYAFLIEAPGTDRVVITQIVITIFMLIYSAPASAVLAELFPTSVRATGVSLTYSLGVAIFGGFTPAITAALVNWTGAPISLAFYLMGAALVSSIAVTTLEDRSGEKLS